MKKVIFLMLCATMLAFSSMAESPKREFRSAWMAGMGID